MAINPLTTIATNAVQVPTVRGYKPPKLGVSNPKMPRYRPAKMNGFSSPRVPSIAVPKA